MLADILRHKSVNRQNNAASHHNQRSRRLTVESLEQRLVLYNLAGSEWADTNISYSYVPDGTDAYGYSTTLFAELNAIAPTATWQREFARALNTWAEAANLNFYSIPDDGSPIPNIGLTQGDSRFGDIRLLARLGVGGFAVAHHPPSETFGFTSPGDITLNSVESFSIGSYPDLYSILLHESGHALGLSHSTSGTVMYGALTGTYSGLTSDDIAGIRAIYGARQPDVYDTVANNDSLGAATSLSVDGSGKVSLGADLTSQADVDFFKLTAPSAFDGTLSVSVDARDLSLLAPNVAIYDAAGNLLATDSAGNDYGTVATVNLSGLSAGQSYFVMADGATNDVFGVGAYQLDVQFGGGDPPEPGITVSPTSGLETSELGGTAQFQAVLQSQPTANVTIPISSNNSNEGVLSVSNLTFTSSDWNTPQTVTVTGVDDSQEDGDVGYMIVSGAAVSSDVGYNGLNPDDVSVTNLDDDAPPPPPPGLDPDRFEVNDSMAAATDLGTTNERSETGLTIHNSSDKDYFSFIPRNRGTYQIATQFVHASGNLDLTVYDTDGNALASSTTNTDNEQVSLSLNRGQRYYFRVHGPAGDMNTHDISIAKVGGGKGNGKPKGANLLPADELFVEHEHAHSHTDTHIAGIGAALHPHRVGDLAPQPAMRQTGLRYADTTQTEIIQTVVIPLASNALQRHVTNIASVATIDAAFAERGDTDLLLGDEEVFDELLDDLSSGISA